jgi:peptidyl-prolyl cis-trans isomerase SurA
MVYLIALVFCLTTVTPDARAQEALRAAAVVNDQVVSMLDLVMRTRLAILGARIEDTPQVRRRIARQVLVRLIDENLQMQEAARLAIEVPDEQVNLALAQIAKQNGMNSEAFVNTLKENAVLPFAIRNQIRAELAWRAVLELRIRPSINIDEDEIDAAVEQIDTQGDTFDRRVAEITLAVPDARQEPRGRELFRPGAGVLAVLDGEPRGRSRMDRARRDGACPGQPVEGTSARSNLAADPHRDRSNHPIPE